MAPSVPLRGLDPDVDYKQFPQVTIDPEYQNEFADVTVNVRTREEWGAKPPTRAPTDRPLWRPLRYIVLSSFHTQQEGNPTRASIMQELQRRDMEESGLPDIQCNWAFGEDGLIYEGRAWPYRPGNSLMYPGFEGRYAEFTFIGDHRVHLATKSVMEFIRYCQVLQDLRKDLRLLEDKRFLKKVSKWNPEM